MTQNLEPDVSLKIKKAQGQLNRVAEMVAQDCYCIDVIQQNLAVIGLLKSIQQDILGHHLNHCFQAGLKSPRKRQQMVTELIRVFNLSAK